MSTRSHDEPCDVSRESVVTAIRVTAWRHVMEGCDTSARATDVSCHRVPCRSKTQRCQQVASCTSLDTPRFISIGALPKLRLYLLYFAPDDDWIVLSDLFLSHLFVIKGALMHVRVAMRAAEQASAATLKTYNRYHYFNIVAGLCHVE